MWKEFNSHRIFFCTQIWPPWRHVKTLYYNNRQKTLLFSLKLICELRNVFISGRRWLQREFSVICTFYYEKLCYIESINGYTVMFFWIHICEIKVQLLPILTEINCTTVNECLWKPHWDLETMYFAFVDRRSRQLFVFVIIDFNCGFMLFSFIFFFGFYLINRPSCFLPYLIWKMSLPC